MPGGTQTNASVNPGEHPNQLDYQHYLLFLSSHPRATLVRSEDHDLVQLPSAEQMHMCICSIHLCKHICAEHLHICNNGTYHQLNCSQCSLYNYLTINLILLAGMLLHIHVMCTIYNVHIPTDHYMLTLLTCLYHINVLTI